MQNITIIAGKKWISHRSTSHSLITSAILCYITQTVQTW